MSSFKELFLVEEKQPESKSVTAKPRVKSSTLPKTTVFVTEKKVSLEEFVNKYESIIKEVNKLFSGLVVRYDQRNIYARVFAVLSYAFYDPKIFKILHNKRLLDKTNYAGQWKVK